MSDPFHTGVPAPYRSWAEVCIALRQSLSQSPRDATLHSNIALALLHCGRREEALAHAETAIGLAPDFGPAWINLSAVLQASGRESEALGAARQVAERMPGLSESHRTLGTLAHAQGHIALATRSLIEAVRVDPSDADAWCNLSLALCDQGQPAQALNAIAKARHLRPASLTYASNHQAIAQYHDALGASELRAIAVSYGHALQAGGVVAMEAPPPRRSGPLRVGYVSADLGLHPVGFLFRGVLAGHDPERVEVHVFDASAADPDPLGLALRAEGGSWERVFELDDHALARRVRERDLDVLVDLSGHTFGNRLGAFGRRPARRQLSLLGWFASTGVPGMDALLMGSGQLVAGHEAFFAEPVLGLPVSQFRYLGPLEDVPVQTGQRREGVVFGCFNNVAKLNARVIECWSELLRALPSSRLVLKWKLLADPEFAATLRQRFAVQGVDPARIELRGRSPHARMLEEYGDIDIALDPFPFSGGMSTIEALWQGVPVVTLAQVRPVSRQTAAVLQAVGLDALIVATEHDYIRRAIELAQDPTRRASLRASLRQGLQASPIGDPAGLSRALEETYAALCGEASDGISGV